MPSVLSPTASLAAQRALRANGDALQVSLQRLSSGLRVNGARDDAAGLAIAERLQAQVRGGTQAARNANDAISLFQTAEGALGQMAERLQRMRELALQSLNGAAAASDIASLHAELRQSLAELDRQAASARFNGRALLDGSLGTLAFQVGAASTDLLELDSGDSSRAAALGALATARTGDLRAVGNRSGGFVFDATYTTVPIASLDFSRPEVRFAGGVARTAAGLPTNYAGGGAAQFTVDGFNVTLNSDLGGLAGVAQAVQAQLNAARPGGYGVTQDGSRLTITKTGAAPSPTAAPQIAAVSGNTVAWTGGSTQAGTAAAATTNAGFTVDGRRVSITTDHTGNFAGLVADIQRQLDASARGAYRVSGSDGGISIVRSTGTAPPEVAGFTGAGASVFARAPQSGLTLAAGDLTVQVGTRRAVSVTGTFLTPDALANAIRTQVGAGVTTLVNDRTGALEINAAETITLAGAAAGGAGALAFASLVNEPEGSLEDAGALAADTARRTLLRVDVALNQVNARRGDFGAWQRRFEAVVAQLGVQTEQQAAARSRIVDADFAAETAALARRRVLQRAALAIVAQANAQPRDVLALLR